MHHNQRQRLVQEICSMLKMSQPATTTSIKYYRQLSAEASEFSNEIIVCACIYLTSKIFEKERRIRDILNTIASAIKLYTIAARESQGGYLKLETVPLGNIYEQIQPDYQLSKYNELKKNVLEAEQYLLRILKFDFTEPELKSEHFKQLLALCDTLCLSPFITQIAINTFNDLELDKTIVVWIPGIIYFSVEVADCESVPHEDIDWEGMFLVGVRKLQGYSERVIQHYESLSKQENEQEQEQ